MDTTRELADLRERLERVMRPAFVDTWLHSPVPALDGATPLAVIARGERERVARLVSELEDPGAS